MKNEVIKCPSCGREFIKKSYNQVMCKSCVANKQLKFKEDARKARYTIFERDDFRCVYCGKSSIEDGVHLELDHIIPYGEVRDNSMYNLITACSECNMHKSCSHLYQDTYERILKRNITRNGSISIERQREIRNILTKYYLRSKEKIDVTARGDYSEEIVNKLRGINNRELYKEVLDTYIKHGSVYYSELGDVAPTKEGVIAKIEERVGILRATVIV